MGRKGAAVGGVVPQHRREARHDKVHAERDRWPGLLFFFTFQRFSTSVNRSNAETERIKATTSERHVMECWDALPGTSRLIEQKWRTIFKVSLQLQLPILHRDKCITMCDKCITMCDKCIT